MELIKSSVDYHNYLKTISRNISIGFVPTMGCLHEGHLSLIKQSTKDNDLTVVSIFINPTQFGENEDFNAYPRTLKKDQQLLKKANIDILFLPESQDIYPKNHESLIQINIDKGFTKKLCGKFRPDHFEGVAIVVMKLFAIIQPDTSYFGLKDYQQYLLIKNMTATFFPQIKIIGMPTLREKNGLAMSSRNNYLQEKDKKMACQIFLSLQKISEIIKQEKTINQKHIQETFHNLLKKNSSNFQLQYLEIFDNELNPIVEYKAHKTFIGTAVIFHNVRLIDNLIF